MHVVDTYPTLIGLAGAKLGKNKPLDGIGMWPTISQGRPSPAHRSHLQHRTLPRWGPRGRLETHLAHPAAGSNRTLQHRAGSSEKNNVAAQNPAKVDGLQKRANELAAVEVKPLLLQVEFQAIRKRLTVPPALPGEEFQFEDEQ